MPLSLCLDAKGNVLMTAFEDVLINLCHQGTKGETGGKGKVLEGTSSWQDGSSQGGSRSSSPDSERKRRSSGKTEG